jgi:hypothetical protein
MMDVEEVDIKEKILMTKIAYSILKEEIKDNKRVWS